MSFLITSFSLTSFILILANMMKKKSFFQKEKNSPFECGFDPFSLTRQPFSIRFFMITIIFLIFDIEIIILLPLPLLNDTITHPMFWKIFMIISMISLGLMYEWKNGMLQWL
uniref:NADH dehydrogenase subunit 3 n=1 Tax=Alectorobius peropteryx TaxID=1265610 RepID=UPI0022384868|nr:NADH dehydrogenase subunit 3 [Alectorobius peropteryx]UYB78502.1 NADH dehydrogenase subunit 3 [Alectorobius peropteryx]UYB78515.1 NADH dehydrogenase subunit 3 [Alectorobius peropteryx]